MKRSYLKLSLLMVFLSFVWSCQQELLQTERDYDLQSQNITVKRLTREELQQRHSDVMQKIEQLSAKKSSDKGKIYTDAENGFSIDTDASVYIEDQYGNKTYTFKAITDKKDPSVLQNIVLKDLGDGTFSVWMTSYDQEILKNREQTSTEFLKQHITLEDLGDKKGSDIFGRLSACFTPIAIYEYIPGIPCSAPQHHADATACSCGTPGHNCTPPTPSSYEFLYYVGTFDCSGGSSGSTGSGTSGNTGGNHGSGTTIPVGGGTTASPCSKVKKPFTKIPTLAASATTFAQNTSANVEHAFSIYATANATTPNPINYYSGGALATSLPPDIPKIMVYAHTHNSPSNTTFSVFSWADLTSFTELYNRGQADSESVFILITADGTRYAFTVNNWVDFKEAAYVPYVIGGESIDEDKLNNSAKIGGKYLEGYTENGVKYEPKIKENSTDKELDLKYFLEMDRDNIMGMNIFEVNPDFTQFTKVSLSFNGQVQRTPCN